jgi:hypothetical protein
MKENQKEIIREKALQLANSRIIKHFTTSYIARKVSVDQEVVEEVLSGMVKEGSLKRIYQLLCSNDYCLRTIAEAEQKEELPLEYCCNVCGQEEEAESVEDLYIRHVYMAPKKLN